MKKAKITNSMYIPSLTYEYPGQFNTDLFIQTSLDVPAISDYFRIQQGIRSGQYIHLVNNLNTVVTAATQDCTPVYTQSGSISDRRIVTGDFEINLEWCKKEWMAEAGALIDAGYVGEGLDGYELAGTLREVIFSRALEAARRDYWKIILFSDNSYGPASTNKYHRIDGLFTAFADAATGYCVKKVSDAFPNAYNSVLAPNQARDAFRALWGEADRKLKQLPPNQKYFLVTGSVWENLYDSIINDCCIEGTWIASQDGLGGTLRYRGIEVRPLWIADEALEESDNPWYNEMRHFIIYTKRENHIVGVENAADLERLEMCYNCEKKTTYIQGESRLGYQFVECYLNAYVS